MNLSELRESKGLSVREVGRRMKKTHPAILKLEERNGAPMDTLRDYAAALGVQLDEVLEVVKNNFQNA